MALDRPIETGHIFFFDSGEGVGQEECGEHPWIVISGPLLSRKSGLVLAVPCTSVDVEHAFDVSVREDAIRAWPNVSHPLSAKRPIRIAKARKIRHFSVDRITEIVGKIEDEDVLRMIRAEVSAAMGM